jgi:pyruvate dehydrogenase E2 component (dihydrolipoamide acetyltransferase)
MLMYPLAVGQTVTRVFEAGQRAAPPLILVHGLTSRADRWRQNLEPLAATGYRVFALDLPGHGFATKSASGDHSIAGYRDFILAFLDKIEAPQAVLVGTSLGGHIVAAAACHQPQRVRALVMIGSLGLQPVTTERVEKIRTGLADMSFEAMRRRLLTVFSDEHFVTDELVREDVLVNTSPGAAGCLSRFCGYMAERFNRDLVLDGLAALGKALPLLLVWGEEDQSVPVAVGRAARERLVDAKLVTFARTNHTPYMERPELFNRVLIDFLGGRLGSFAAPELTYR